jgi:surface antigen
MFRSLRAAFCVVMLAAVSAGASAQDFGDRYWQCAPFARLASGIQIFGNARTWWDQAEGRYERGRTPTAGAVLVFKAAGKMRYGHVAMVTDVVDARTIKVTHANWSPINGSRGQVEENVEVVDVSEGNDWSEVRVFYAPLSGLGAGEHPTYGFVYPDAEAMRLAAVKTGDATVQMAALSGGESRLDAIGDLIEASAITTIR